MNDTPIHAQNLVGQNLGRYRIQELLGRGGMAWVYRAWDQQLERAVAIKVVMPQALEMEQSMARFQREARAIARLDHPHIVQLYDFGAVQGLPYMVMPYIAGPNLEERLRQAASAGQPLPRADILNILGQVAAALDHAHALGLIHRDVKPSNILFKTPEHAVLSDFGVARLNPGVQGQHPTLTDADQVLGTPTYMAPEQATRTVPASPASDVYSLAVVAYEMIGGQPPFEADSTLSAILQHILEPPPSIRGHRPALPPAVDEVLQQALDKDPTQRFATATAFVTALAAAWAEAEDTAAEDTAAQDAAAPALVAEPAVKREGPASEAPPPVVDRPTAATLPPATRPAPRPAWPGRLAVIGVLALLALGAVGLGVWWAVANGSQPGPTPAPATATRSPAPPVTPRASATPTRAAPVGAPTVAPTRAPAPATVAPTRAIIYEPVYGGTREAGGTFIRGQVLDPQGRPVPGALVELYSPDWKWLQTTGVNAEGRYEFIVSPDTYHVRLKEPPGAASQRVAVAYSHEALVNWQGR